MHRDGFGFVIPDASSLDARLKAQLSGDIFIPPPPSVPPCMATGCWSRSARSVPTAEPKAASCARSFAPTATVVGIFHYGIAPQLRHPH